MLEYLMQLPCETMGKNMLGYLELVDIIQLEKASASHKWRQLLQSILPYCPPIIMHRYMIKCEMFNWFNKRRCCVKHATIPVESLCGKRLVQHYIFNDIEICLNFTILLQHVEPLRNPYINRGISHVKIKGYQDPAVIDVLFSLFNNTNSSVRSLSIVASNLSEWIEHISKIGPYLREMFIDDFSTNFPIIKNLSLYCPYLEKLILNYGRKDSERNILLQTIASHFPHLRSLTVSGSYPSSAEADADLTAFTEKCPQLEELSINCRQLTDQSMIALAQYCSRLKKLKLECTYTAASLIALSEHGRPLQELIIPRIPIPSAEIAAQCDHALSRIRELHTYCYSSNVDHLLYLIPFMTGLRVLDLSNSEDHLLVSRLLLLQGYFAGLEIIFIRAESSITPIQLCEIVAMCMQLHTLDISNPTCVSDALLVELARSCPHLQEVTLYSSSKVTEEGVLALAAHCRQLRELVLLGTTVNKETVSQLVQHCRRLTSLYVRNTTSRHPVYLSSKEIRALREQMNETRLADVITDHRNSTSCIIM